MGGLIMVLILLVVKNIVNKKLFFMARSRRFRRRKKLRAKRRKQRVNRLISYRAGQIGYGYGKPFLPFTVTTIQKTTGFFKSTGTTAGDYANFDITNCNDAAGTGGSMATNTSNRHNPSHDNAITAGFNRVRPISATYRFDISFNGTDAATKDFIVAWCFSQDAYTFTYTAGNTTESQWMNIRNSPTWRWKRFSGTQSGGSVYPSTAPVVVHVPAILKHVKKFQKNITTEALNANSITSSLTDSTATSTYPLYLNLHFFTVTGDALAAEDIHIDFTCTQKIKYLRAMQAADIVETPDTHP